MLNRANRKGSPKIAVVSPATIYIAHDTKSSNLYRPNVIFNKNPDIGPKIK